MGVSFDTICATLCQKISYFVPLFRGGKHHMGRGAWMDYVITISKALPFPFFSNINGTKKGSALTCEIKKFSYRAVPRITILDTNSRPFLYTWYDFNDRTEEKQDIKGTPTTILNDRATKAMVGPFSVKGVLWS